MKLKTYVITLSKHFPAYHIKKGNDTDFERKLLEWLKKHTIRANYAYWKPKIDEVNAGKAVLSVRQWIDRPYHKPGQREIKQFTKLGIQKCDVEIINHPDAGLVASITINEMPLYPNYYWQDVAANDGLTDDDFISWFKKPIVDGCIIHFTDLRY